MNQLTKHFKTEDWEAESVKTLLLGLPDTTDSGEVDIYSLISIGLLWCAGSPKEKAEAFYKTVKNPSSGDHIEFEAEEREQVVPKIIYIASVFTYDQIMAFESLQFDYDENLIQLAIPILQNSEDDGIIPKIFGEEED